MMGIKKFTSVILLGLIIVSCSNRLTLKNINKPFYRSFEIGVRESYKPYEAFIDNDTMKNIPKFKDYYENGKYEVDIVTNFRTKVIDSLGLLNKDNWLFINRYSHGSSGPYYRTYIFEGNKYYKYEYSQFDMTKQGLKSYVYEYNIDRIRKDDEDIADIYNAFQSIIIPHKINITADTYIEFEIISVKDRKVKSYKTTSRDYVIQKW